MIVVGVELPGEDMLGGSNVKRVAEDWRSRMRRRPQPNNLWTERDRPVVPVLRPVIQSDLYGHPSSCCPRLEFLDPFIWRNNAMKAPGSRGLCYVKLP